MPVHKIHPSRYVICSAILIASLTVLSYRVISLQWLHREAKDEMSRKTSHIKKEIYPAYRGLIIDTNEEPLVVNVPLTNIYADKYHLEEEDLISWGVAYHRLRYTEEWAQADKARRKKLLANKRFSLLNNERASLLIEEHYSFLVSIIAKPLQMNKEELLKLLRHPRKKYIRLAKNLNQTDADYIKRLLKENYVFGLNFEKKLTRHYPSPEIATHLIGYTKDYQGQTGIEAKYNKLLSGTDGFHKRKSNPKNLSIYSDEEEVKLPVQGFNVQLAIDTTLQSIVEEELQLGLIHAEAEKGCAIMIDPKTGDILAMANRPHYNLNTREGVSDGSFNYSFMKVFEPGSTFKMITAAAALNERYVTITKPLIDCEHGYFREGGVTLKDDYPRGEISVKQILAKSNNIGSYKLGRQVGRKRFMQYIAEFGFGKKTPLNWRSEQRTRGVCGPSAQEFASSTFGYGVSVTPMHMAIAYATLANDGVMMKPTLVKSVIANDGTVIEHNPPQVERKVLDADVAQNLRKALTAVTEKGGTGTKARVPGFNVAGKTGTTKIWGKLNPDDKSEKAHYLDGRYICTFAGMMPAENPAFVVYIVVDDPQTTSVSRYGGVLAAPIFAKIAERTASYKDLAPTVIDEDTVNFSE